MAQFDWVATPSYGFCITCMTSQNDRGFVQMISDVSITDEIRGQVVGVADMVMCGSCLEQAARLVGCATRQETEALAQKEYETETEIEKLKDEIESHQQRFDNLINSLAAGAAVNTGIDPAAFKRPGLVDAQGIEVSDSGLTAGKAELPK